MANFNIQPLSQFGSNSTTIRRPRHFLQFSYDRNKTAHVLSDSSLKFFYPPYIETPGVRPPTIDLKRGYSAFERSDESVDRHLDALLHTLQAHEEDLVAQGARPEDAKIKSDIVTWRGVMTKILTAPFDFYSDFEFNATCYQGTIFIEEHHAYAYGGRIRQNDARPRHGELSQDMMQYCGYKFESLSTLPRPWPEMTRDEIEARDAEIVNNNEQYCSIVRTGIGNTSLVMAGEVDCIKGGRLDGADGTNEPIPWVELKTTTEPTSQNASEARKYERKLLKYWAQSFLLGVPTIVVGYRSPQGYLTGMKELETSKIPTLVSKNENTWNGNVCINMTASFLEFLKATIMGTEGVWRIKRQKGDPVIQMYRIIPGGSWNILTPGFKAHRDRMAAAEIAARLG